MGLQKVSKKAPVKQGKKSGGNDNILKEVEVGPYTVRVEMYRGKTVSLGIHDTQLIELEKDYTLVVGFGVKKAQAIVECLDEIKEFVEEHGE